MPPLHPTLSSDQLRDVNDLTLFSRQPGHLDYRAYLKYLEQLGHVKDHIKVSAGIVAPARPQNSRLQNNNGDRIDDKTDFRSDQALWSQDNLPAIIYIFDKPAYWLEKVDLKNPPQKRYTIYGERLRDIPILPDHISSKLEGWRVEAWMRFDPRVSLRDIIERMYTPQRPVSKSVIQMRTLRFREDCHVLGWVALGKTYEQRKKEIRKVLIKAGINLNKNTTRGISWGLKDVSLGEAGGRVVVPEARRLENTVDMSGISNNTNVSTLATIAESVITSDDDISSLMSMSPAQGFSRITNTESDDEQAEHRNRLLSPFMNVDAPEIPDIADYDNIIPVDTIGYRNHNQDVHLPRLPPAPQHVVPTAFGVNGYPIPPQNQPTLPNIPASEEATTVMYHNEPLTLKTTTERTNNALFLSRLREEWHPSGSAGRRLQLAYLLDEEKVKNGFVDNRGFWEPVGGAANWGCIEEDIIYG